MQQTRRTTGRLSLAIAAVVAGMIATTATAAAAPKTRVLPATGPGAGSATAQRLGAVGPQLATAAVPPNDDAADATFLSRDVRVAADVTAATSAGEPDAGCPF